LKAFNKECYFVYVTAMFLKDSADVANHFVYVLY